MKIRKWLRAIPTITCLLAISIMPLQAAPKKDKNCENMLSIRELGLSASAAVLAILESGPNFGTAIIENFSQRNVHTGPGVIYELLPQLVDRGFISELSNEDLTTLGLEKRAPGDGRGRVRIYYQLTDAGRKRLQLYRKNILFFLGIQLDN